MKFTDIKVGHFVTEKKHESQGLFYLVSEKNEDTFTIIDPFFPDKTYTFTKNDGYKFRPADARTVLEAYMIAVDRDELIKQLHELDQEEETYQAEIALARYEGKYASATSTH